MKPKVSVCLITYNHKSYIAQAIDGVLMQRTDFRFELIIADDCSTDGTQEILKDYKQKYPTLITLILQEKNIGPALNWLELITTPGSKYIAYFEGDDYWTDPLKLQKQFDILEQNPDCKICFTNCSKLTLQGEIIPSAPKNISIKTGFEDILKGNYISTLTAMLVNNNDFVFPAWYKSLSIGDWPFYLWILRNSGRIYFLEENTATYRADIGLSTNIRKNPLMNLNIIKGILEAMSTDQNFKNYKSSILNALYLQETRIMSFYMKNKKYGLGLRKFTVLFFKKASIKLIRLFMYSFKESFR